MAAIKGTRAMQLIRTTLLNNGLTNYTRRDVETILKTLRCHPSTSHNGYARSGIRYTYDEDIVTGVAGQYAHNKLAGMVIQPDSSGKALVTGNLFRNPAHRRRWEIAANQSMYPDDAYRERFALILLTADPLFWNEIEPYLKPRDFDFSSADTHCRTDEDRAILQLAAEIWGFTPTWYDPCITVLLSSCDPAVAEVAAAVLLKTVQVIRKEETP